MSPLLHCCAAIGVHHILRSRCLATRSAEHSGDNRIPQSTYSAPFSRALVSQQLPKCILHRSRLIISTFGSFLFEHSPSVNNCQASFRLSKEPTLLWNQCLLSIK